MFESHLGKREDVIDKESFLAHPTAYTPFYPSLSFEILATQFHLHTFLPSCRLCLSLSLDLFSFVSPSPPDSIYPRLNTKPINHTTQPGHHPGRRHRLPYLSPPPRPHQPHTQQHQRQRRPRLSRSVPQQQQAADHVDRPRYLPVRRGREGDVGVDAGFVVGEGGGVVGDWG